MKELAKIPRGQRKKVETFLFDHLQEYNHLFDIPGLKKLQGYKNYYRLRFGNYRAGIRYENNTIYFERLLHRKDMYKFYP
ncbi:type II toxin-antitoxin system RelE family toxin [Tangfeifania diversioriginum]|uniref:type II toxin-antitoxin system RelE family toxin n=1 Tax=Tangfeifania diversioriginum TaxID=1168035 RepID=UPI00373FD941